MSTAVETAQSQRAETGVPDPKRWWAMVVVDIAQLLIVLDATVVNIALPKMQTALDISTANRQWALTAYTLAFGGLLLLGGRIADYTGRKRAFIIGLLGFAAASAIGGLAQNQGMLFGARAVQGAMAALMAPSALSLLTVAFTKPKERAMAFGIFGAIAGGGSAVGLILGGVLTEYASWRWSLLISTPIAIAAALGASAWVRDSRAHGNTRYDIPGAVTSTLGLMALVYGFTQAAPKGPGEASRWGSGEVIGLFVAAFVLLVGFVVIETRTRNPLLPLRVIRDRNRGGSYLVSLIIGVSLFASFLFLSYYMQQTMHYTPLKSGIAFLPFTFGIVAGAMLSTQILPRVGPRIPMTVGLSLATVGMILLTTLGVHSGFWSHVFPIELIISIGMGIVFGPLTNTALVGVGDHDAGVASALVNTAQQVGGSIGISVLNTIAITATTSFFAANPTKGQQVAVVHGYSTAYWVSAGLMALGVIVAALFIRARADQLHTESAVPAAA